jgi:hypothetical protein
MESCSGPFDVASLGLSINDILQFQDRFIEPIFELTRIVTGESYDVDGFREVHRRCGYEMWNILAGTA